MNDSVNYFRDDPSGNAARMALEHQVPYTMAYYAS